MTDNEYEDKIYEDLKGFFEEFSTEEDIFKEIEEQERLAALPDPCDAVFERYNNLIQKERTNFLNNVKSNDFYVLYKTTCLINGKEYIGSFKVSKDNPRSKSAYLRFKIPNVVQDLEKYGSESFVRDDISIFFDQETLEEAKRALLTKEWCKSPLNYNRRYHKD